MTVHTLPCIFHRPLLPIPIRIAHLTGEKYAAEHAKLEDEYSKKADAVEDRIESLKNEKKIESGFISYITNFRRGQQTASSKPKSAKRGSR